MDNGGESRATVLTVTGDVAHTLRAEGADASEDGTGRGTPIVAFTSKDHGADAGLIAPTLRAMPHDASHANGGGQVAVAYSPATAPCLRSGNNYNNSDAGMEAQMVVAFHQTQDPIHGDDVTPALGASGIGMGVAVPIDVRNVSRSDDSTGVGTPGTGVGDDGDPAFSLSANGATQAVANTTTVRRLTPVECERLQGFPDGWTAHRVQQTGAKAGTVVPQADSNRYRQMGNAVPVHVMRWVLARILDTEAAS